MRRHRNILEITAELNNVGDRNGYYIYVLDKTKVPAMKEDQEDLVFTSKGRTVQVDEAFVYADFEEAWGSPRIEKAQACIGGGYDENYYFGDHLAVSTLGDSGEQVIYDIFVDEPGFATAKGAEIGRTDRDALHRIYGDPEGSFGRTDRYSAGGILVSFTFDGGILSGIDYNHTQN